MNKKAKVRAHSNIALIKYWGKRDEEFILPRNSSLSLTLEALYTETEVEFREDLERDYFYLNDEEIKGEEALKVFDFVSLFRKKAKITNFAIIKSFNHVPTAAGLASSASGFAALAGALNEASGLKLDKKELSMMARMGSGSATRSIYGGFVEWDMGTGPDDSYAKKIDKADWDIAMVIVVVNNKKKKVSSRTGMKITTETSPFYEAWVESSKKDLIEIKDAIKNKDFIKLGEITERNSLKMHATMFSANPPICYLESDSLKVMELVKEMREEGIMAYFTMDAGPNVKILCRESQMMDVKNKLKAEFKEDDIITSRVGKDIVIL